METKINYFVLAISTLICVTSDSVAESNDAVIDKDIKSNLSDSITNLTDVIDTAFNDNNTASNDSKEKNHSNSKIGLEIHSTEVTINNNTEAENMNLISDKIANNEAVKIAKINNTTADNTQSSIEDSANATKRNFKKEESTNESSNNIETIKVESNNLTEDFMKNDSSDSKTIVSKSNVAVVSNKTTIQRIKKSKSKKNKKRKSEQKERSSSKETKRLKSKLKKRDKSKKEAKKKATEKLKIPKKTKLRKQMKKKTTRNKSVESDETQPYDHCGCQCLANNICSDVKYFKTQNSKNISLNSECIDIDNFENGSDTSKCFEWALLMIQQVQDVIDNAKNIDFLSCFNFNGPTGETSGEVFHILLNDLINILNKLTSSYILQLSAAGRFKDQDANLKAARDAIAKVNFALDAIDGAMCKRKFPEGKATKFFKHKSQIDVPCECIKDKCRDNKCPNTCKVICKNKYGLGRWSCRADSGVSSVPVQMLCDGVKDCADGSDEKGCNQGKTTFEKFKGNTLYNEVIELIRSKLKELHDTDPLKVKIFRLHADVSEMVQLNFASQNDTAEFVVVRDYVFKSLPKLYGLMVNDKMKTKVNETMIFTFFKTINEKLGDALKYSYTGNGQRFVQERCYCEGSTCGVPGCSELCRNICFSNSNLSRYLCKYSKMNGTVAIETLCDGVRDCPNGEDEENCETGLCHSSDLVHLREDIFNMVDDQKGTILAEYLKAWQFEMLQKIKKEEGSRNIKNSIKRIAYASIKVIKALKRNRQIRDDQQLVEISQRMIERLKWCGN